MATVSDYVNVVIRGDSSKAVNAIRRVTQSLRRLAVGAQQVGTAMATMGVGALIAMGKVLQVTLELDDSLRRMSAKMGLNFDGDEFKGMAKMVRQLGKEFPTTTAAVANLGVVLGSLNVGSDEMENMLKTSIKLGSAVGVPIEEAGKGLKQMMNQFKLPEGIVDKAQHFADILTYSDMNSAADFRSTIEAYSKMGKAADAAGVSVHHVAAEVMAMHDANVSGGKAGRSDTAAFLKMWTDPAAQDALKKYGINLREMYDAGANVSDVMLKLEENLNKTTLLKPEKLGVMVDVFGRIGAKGAVAFLGIGDAVRENEIALMSLINTTERAYQTIEGGAAGQVRRLRSAWEGLILSVGDGMKKYVAVMSTGLIDQIKIMEQWAKANPTFGVQALGAAFLVAAAGAALLTTAVAAITISGILSFFVSFAATLLALPILIVPILLLVSAFGDTIESAFSDSSTVKSFGAAFSEAWVRAKKAIESVMVLIAHGKFKLAFKLIIAEAKKFATDMVLAMKPLADHFNSTDGGKFFNAIAWLGGRVADGAAIGRAGISGVSGEAQRQWALNDTNDKLASGADFSKDLGQSFGFYRYVQGGGMDEYASRLQGADNAQRRFTDSILGMDESGQSWADMMVQMNAENERLANGINATADAILAEKEATKGLSDEQRAALGDEQRKKLEETYGDARKAESEKRRKADEIARRNAGKAHFDRGWANWKKAGFEAMMTISGYAKEMDWTGEENWEKTAKKAAKLIRTITNTKLGDFDVNTAKGKMNQALNEGIEKQLAELQQHTEILTDIKTNTANFGGIKIGA